MADERKAAMKRRARKEQSGLIQENFDLMVTRTKAKSSIMEAKRTREKNAATRKRVIARKSAAAITRKKLKTMKRGSRK